MEPNGRDEQTDKVSMNNNDGNIYIKKMNV